MGIQETLSSGHLGLVGEVSPSWHHYGTIQDHLLPWITLFLLDFILFYFILMPNPTLKAQQYTFAAPKYSIIDNAQLASTMREYIEGAEHAS